jgi:chaperonin GroES
MTDADRDVKQSVRMTADRLLVVPSQEAGERKSRAGIVIPATAEQSRRLAWGEVVAVGPTVRNVEPGDQVLFAPDSGYEVEIRGDEYLIMRERDIHATASDRDDDQTGLYL